MRYTTYQDSGNEATCKLFVSEGWNGENIRRRRRRRRNWGRNFSGYVSSRPVYVISFTYLHRNTRANRHRGYTTWRNYRITSTGICGNEKCAVGVKWTLRGWGWSSGEGKRGEASISHEALSSRTNRSNGEIGVGTSILPISPSALPPLITLLNLRAVSKINRSRTIARIKHQVCQAFYPHPVFFSHSLWSLASTLVSLFYFLSTAMSDVLGLEGCCL